MKDGISYPEDGNATCLQIEDGSFWFRHRNHCIVNVVHRFPPSGQIIDVGGGNGFVAAALKGAGYDVGLLEPGKSGVAAARARGIDAVQCNTLEAADFAPDSIPAVGLFDVVEHIEDDAAFLKSVCHVLKPGGRLYLTAPAFSALYSDVDRFAGHFRRYTRSQLRRLLTSSGFDVSYGGYIFTLLPLPILLLRTLPSLIRAAFGRPLPLPASGHVAASGRGLDWLWTWEVAAIRRGLELPLGGSCLMVARKPPRRGSAQ